MLSNLLSLPTGFSNMCTCCMLVTEVACSDAIRQARVTRVQSRGLKMLKRVNLKRSESGTTHTVFKKFGQSIDVKISTTDLPTKMSFPYVKFSSWLRYIVEYDNLDCLVGTGDVEKMRPVLTTFWKRFEALYPHHVICDRAEGDRTSTEACVSQYSTMEMKEED